LCGGMKRSASVILCEAKDLLPERVTRLGQ